MTKEEARLFKARWQLANERIVEEIRSTPVSVKLQQLAEMYDAGRSLGWSKKLKADEQKVRERWLRLKELLDGQT
ncbi:MAG: hypothetical protein L0229_30955 [Blastocatellia bacterium]|nr:hypothetical protein [Blastocatellia bacterium]